MAGKKEPCKECGKEYQVPYLYQHLREQHGVYGGASGLGKPGMRKKPATGRGKTRLPAMPVLQEHLPAVVVNGKTQKKAARPPRHLVQSEPDVEILDNFSVIRYGSRIGVVEWIR